MMTTKTKAKIRTNSLEQHRAHIDDSEQRADQNKQVGEETKQKKSPNAGEDALDEYIDERVDEKPVTVFGHVMYRSDVVKLLGLLAFIVLTVGVAILAWPLISGAFTEGGAERIIDDVHNAGPLGVFILLAAELLQVIVAFIPGEVVQMAAGMLYGPWLGALIILVGSFFASWIIYSLVSRLGRPFVKRMVSMKYLDKLDAFERSGKMDVAVFILFLLPGMPKDALTYIIPLTDMSKFSYLSITTVARIPGVLLSTYAASGIVDGNFKMVAIIVAIILVLCALCVVFRDNIMSFANGQGLGNMRESVRSLGGLRSSAKTVHAANKEHRAERKEERAQKKSK